ncbi:MAG: ferredoxin family protein [Candidatus Omnitrophota bacterium]
MPKITINKDKCKGCYLCIEVCPKRLISKDEGLNINGYQPVKFRDSKECIGCALCAIICPDSCIEVWQEKSRKKKY